MSSPALLWELVKKNNAFISKNVNGTIWSKEPCNLAGKHSFKYSGLANRNSNVGVTEENGAVTIMLGSKKNGIKSQKTAVKKNARRAAHAAGAVAAKRRPDLVTAAKAKASALSRGLRARKARSA